MSEIRADKIHNVTGDNDSGIDLSTNDQVVIKTADTTAVTVDSSQIVTFAGNVKLIDGAVIDCAGDLIIDVDGRDIFFNDSGTTFGQMGSNTSGHLFIGKGDTGIRFQANEVVAPCNPESEGILRDDVIDLGAANSRFDDIHATNSTIQTSDQQEKNTITDSDLGLDFIKRLSPKSYIFNGKTRTHYGLIAQDVETVLTDINKPTSGFAGFIKSDISEKQDGSSHRYGLRYTEFVAPLIKAIKEQQTIIEDLQARITALESE